MKKVFNVQISVNVQQAVMGYGGLRVEESVPITAESPQAR